MDWVEEVHREYASHWPCEEGEEEEDYLHWRGRIVNGIAFSEADWKQSKPYRDKGWLFMTAYNDEKEDHIGPIRLEINMNDSFCYASAWSTPIPFDRLQAVFAACEANDSEMLSSIAADIEGIPPVNEVIDRMEKSGTVPAEKIAYYRKQMKDSGREKERW